MTTPTLREALERCDHTLTAHGHIDANTPLHDTIRAALSSPAPDRLSEEERASIESARKALSAYRETLSDGQLIAFPDLLEKSVAIIDRLSRQPEAEPVAWIEFADNGNIRFWTSDPARAWTEGDNGRPLRKFTLAEIVALAASPRLDREKALAALKPFAWPPLYVFDTPNNQMWVPTRMPDDWIGGGGVSTGEYRNAREAIMRETR